MIRTHQSSSRVHLSGELVCLKFELFRLQFLRNTPIIANLEGASQNGLH